MSLPPDPPPITEAAGLLTSGVIFPRRVGLRRGDDPAGAADILLGFKRGGFSIYMGDAPLLHFDLDGRWQRAFIAGTHYLKGLDTRTQAVERVREGEAMVLRRRTLAAGESAQLDATIATEAGTLAGSLAEGRFDLIAPPIPSQPIPLDEIQSILGRITAWDAAAWNDHRRRYEQVYGPGPVPFLPPDCPNPVILRADAHDPVAAVAARARGVAALLGQRSNGMRDVFLAGSGWLDRPEAEVLELLAAINEVFPIQPDFSRPRALEAGPDAPRFTTIHGWLAAIPRLMPTPADWSRFRAAHLGRITLRVDPSVTPDLGAIEATVFDLKDAAISVGLACFVRESVPPMLAGWLAQLPLTKGDLIALVTDSETDAMGDPAFLADLKTRVAAILPPGPRVVIYNPDKQWI